MVKFRSTFAFTEQEQLLQKVAWARAVVSVLNLVSHFETFWVLALKNVPCPNRKNENYQF
jgi:hypothetical protein